MFEVHSTLSHILTLAFHLMHEMRAPTNSHRLTTWQTCVHTRLQRPRCSVADQRSVWISTVSSTVSEWVLYATYQRQDLRRTFGLDVRAQLQSIIARTDTENGIMNNNSTRLALSFSRPNSHTSSTYFTSSTPYWSRTLSHVSSLPIHVAYSAGSRGTNSVDHLLVTFTVPKQPGSRTPKWYMKNASCRNTYSTSVLYSEIESPPCSRTRASGSTLPSGRASRASQTRSRFSRNMARGTACVLGPMLMVRSAAIVTGTCGADVMGTGDSSSELVVTGVAGELLARWEACA